MENSKKFLRTAIVYVRDFNKESLNPYGIDEQQKAIINYASENGYRIVKVFREKNVSAKTFNRPQFQEMIAYLKENKWKIKFLVVADMKRLSTDPAGLKRLLKILRSNGIKTISIVQSMLRSAGKQAKQHL